MFPGEDMLQEGIAAFQAGDRARAHELLSEVVKVDPENEQAWYYLAASEGNPALRKQYLEQVLDINPSNAKAREVLERIKSREAAAAQSEPAPATSTSGERKSRIRPLDPVLGAAASVPDNAPGSFRIPVQIPGAPERVTPESLAASAVALLRTGVLILSRQPGVYADEVLRATWWRFWLIAGGAALGSAVLSIFNALFLQIRYSTSLFNIFTILLTPIFVIPVALITLYVGCYASYQWAIRHGGGGSLLRHSYTVALVWAPVVLLNSFISLVFNLIGIGSGLTTLLVNLYSWYLIAEGFENLHLFTDTNQKWITAAVMVIADILATLVLGVLLGGLIVAGALPFALF